MTKPHCSSIVALFVLQSVGTGSFAQRSTDYLKAFEPTDCAIVFDVNAEGTPFRVNWGMDAAWDNEANIQRGTNHIGKNNLSIGRVAYQPTDLVTDNGDGSYELSEHQKTLLKSRCNHIKNITGVTRINITADQAAYLDNDTYKAAYLGKWHEWYKCLKATVKYCKELGMDVCSVSPFNEPDYGDGYTWGWLEGYKSDFLQICKWIREDHYFDDIRISGGNTLNCDQALPWYTYLKDYLEEGNTHQLAGSMNNYATFFTTVKADEKVATADELHNVADAIVGVNYGMENGIWWGFDAKARGQFCIDSNEGSRIGYGEDRTHWTAGAVYRNESTGEIHGYIGSSERQAANSSFSFVSTAKDVYFNGYGPSRQWVYNMPGGTAYQEGQTNAELLINITGGDDVQPDTINGTYQLMCRAAKRILSLAVSTAVSGTNVCIKTPTVNTYDDWKVAPVSAKVGGDYSYFTIRNGVNSFPIDVWNWSLSTGGDVKLYDGSGGDNEQWYLKYAGEGYYYIISRYSNLYLTAVGTTNGSNVNQSYLSTTEAGKKFQQWKIIPTDATCETALPATPTGLVTKPQSASISLNWAPNTDADLAGYMILRSDTSGVYNTIARKVKTDRFVDNNCEQGRTYFYKIKAIDYSDNISVCSDSVVAQTTDENALIANWQFDKILTDNTANHFDVKIGGTEKYVSTPALIKSGKSCLTLDGSSFVQLPYQIANMDEMTICMWVRWTGTSVGNRQRIFDFGNSTNQYMYLTPSNGSSMRLGIKNGGTEQFLDASKLVSSIWRHVAATIGKDSVKIYVNGKLAASTADITIRPSEFKPVLNYFGRSQYNDDPIFKGYLDDVRIYNHELSAAAIANVANDLKEDVNTDGAVDTQDILKIYSFIQTTTGEEVSAPDDVNADGTVDTQDILKVYEFIQEH